MIAVIFAILAFVATLYGGVGLVLYLRQGKLQYAPSHIDGEGKGTKLFKPWRGEGGEFLGYYRPVADPRRIVVLFHGSSGEALDRSWADDLVPAKDLLILAEYPGYGARLGKISEASLLADAEKLVFAARQSWGRNLFVLAVGEGLGAAVASYVASLKKVDRLALISPFSTEQVASKRYRFYPVKWLLRDKYNTFEFLQSADAPLHVVHGTLDEFVPLEHGRAIYQAYPGDQKQLDEVPGFGHANLVHAILHSPFTARFRQFIAE